MPTFSSPTDVTNPLFPVSAQRSVLLLGEVDGGAFRTEVTLLPETRTITWEGQTIKALVSQYVAHLDGRLIEVAYDFYAQADDGSVWYLGEDVFNFADGAIVDTHGTWQAGIDGPAAMIMPAEPKVGDVYRPENAPGLVFEEVVVKDVARSLDGPFGPIADGLEIIEIHMDGATESKLFAPGYGEFFTEGDGDVEATAMAVPTDAAAAGAMPAEFTALSSGAHAAVDAIIGEDWAAAATAVTAMQTAWGAHDPADVARLIEPELDGAIGTLAAAVDKRDAATAGPTAIDAARLALDLQLRHRAPVEIDLARFDLWAALLILDAATDEPSLVMGDQFGLDYVRDRIRDALSPADATRINGLLESLNGAVADEDLEAAAEIAGQLRAAVDGVNVGG